MIREGIDHFHCRDKVFKQEKVWEVKGCFIEEVIY
jgi:hypothetical protein